MTQEEIIKLAQEAGFENYAYEAVGIFERFARLVSAAEREKFTNTQEFVTLRREVVEQALECLEDNISYDFNGNPYEESDWLMQTAAINLSAALEQPDTGIPASVPDGWKLVPVEPTPDMQEAGIDAHYEAEKKMQEPNAWEPGGFAKRKARASHVYRAMLAAAPQPPTTEQSSVDQPQGEQEPRAWLHIDRLGGEQAFTNEPPPSLKAKCQPLYTHSQNLNCKSTQARLAALWGYVKEQPQREPLTDDRIMEIFHSVWTNETKSAPVPPMAIRVARAIEAAHNIK